MTEEDLLYKNIHKDSTLTSYTEPITGLDTETLEAV